MRADFPLFANHPDLVYLDSAATTQKPAYVIDGVKHYLEHDYANIHRGWYSLSERSEELYREARQAVAKLINAADNEIVFTSSSTGASNLLAQSLASSELLSPGDTILLTELEHHANVVPRQMIAEEYGYELDFVRVDDQLAIDIDEFKQKAASASLVAFTYVSNVTGAVQPIAELTAHLPEETITVVDASQAVPHIDVDVQELDCDFLFFTGHKMLAFTGVGVLYGRASLLDKLPPAVGGGSAISSVTTEGYTLLDAPDKFEPGTPNLIGVVSLLKAIEYAETLGGFVGIGALERDMIEQTLQGLTQREDAGKLRLLGPATSSDRIGLFSFQLTNDQPVHRLGQQLALKDICIRCGGHCAQPLHDRLGATGSCRVSLYGYNTPADIERFFKELDVYLDG